MVLLHQFVLRPSNHLSIVGREEAILLYALLKGYKIDVEKMIENSILIYSKGKCRRFHTLQQKLASTSKREFRKNGRLRKLTLKPPL